MGGGELYILLFHHLDLLSESYMIFILQFVNVVYHAE